MKTYLAGLTAIHDGEMVYRGLYTGTPGHCRQSPATPGGASCGAHASGYGKKGTLCESRLLPSRSVAIPRDESDADTDPISIQHAENPLFQCRFRWTENAIAFWDNRCSQHRAMWDYWPHTRSGTRVTIKGERPI